ncbi:hypothetical protein [Modestobacter versicolor]|uniref:Fis family transcriptional regulator n=1 Tax=Modestobacter versicolor TaxID=429133 RepID=A0A323V8G9_9ACTN|nr:hypothetical protein [Modestobacter versicolor]MBB3678686.1 hypothetical protein [Modestobacter versicolor]PZA20343.1 hypothetical protein DMO24_15990 [Modestobacter versicolor]
MRWEQLFADLEAQVAEQEAAAEQAEEPSRARAEFGRVLLADRLRGAVGQQLSVRCRGAGELAGRLVDVGVDWLLLVDGQARELLLAAEAVTAVGGLGTVTAPASEAGEVARRLDLRRALRGLARDRAAVSCLLVDGGVLTGTLDRVGADFVELAEHPLDQPRRRGAVQAVRALPLRAVVAVRTSSPAVG